MAGAGAPASAQYSLGTNHSPFTTAGQPVTLSFYLGNPTASDVTVTGTVPSIVTNPSCTNPILVPANTTKTCTVVLTTTLNDVAANKLSVATQWDFCDTPGCAVPYSFSNVYNVAYQGVPIVTGTSANIPYNSSGVPIDLTANITGVTNALGVATAPAHGTTTISGKVITYTPTSGFYGVDNFAYTAIGPNGSSVPATISVTVANPPAPTVSAANLTVPYNSAGTPIDLTSKITGVATSIALTSSASHGTATVNGNVITFVPTPGYIGPDAFSFTATGPGGTSAPAAVSVTVAPPPAPVASDTAIAVTFNSPGTQSNLTNKVSGIVTSLAVATGPSHGTVSFSGMSATYKPTTNYTGADSFTYTASGPGGVSAPATVTVSVAPQIIPTGSVTIAVSTTGGDGTFTFSSTIPGATSFSMTTAGGTATKIISGVAAGTYSVAQASAPANFRAQSAQCSSGSASSFQVTGGGSTTCSFSNGLDLDAVKTRTEATVRNFMTSRANALLSSEPDTARRHSRLSGSLDGDGDDTATSNAPPPRVISGPGDGGGPRPGSGPQGAGRFSRQGLGDQAAAATAAPANISGNMQDGNGSVSFSTSLSQMRQSVREAQDGRMSLGGSERMPAPVGLNRPALFDIWLEAHTSAFEDSTGGSKRKGNADLVYVGADYVVHKAVLIGALIQFDRVRESSTALGTSANGAGWMAGPYLSARLTKNITFDARAAWGQSSNTVNAIGTLQDSFATNRALASAKLAGNWYNGAWRFTPTLDVAYFLEQQKAFTSISGAAISGQNVALGRMTVGPEFGYRIKTEDGGVFEPYASAKLLWDFKKDSAVSIAGVDVGTTDVRGKIEAGATFTAPSGVSVKAAASYDGIGDKNYHAIGGKLSVGIPLQ